MIVDFIPPEKSTPFYDKLAHKNFCKSCDKNGIPEDKRLEYAETMGVGFGYVYMCELEKAIRSRDVNYELDRADGKINRFDKALDLAAQKVGEKVGEAMTPYLLKCNGKVDCWPSPVYPDAFSVALTSKHHSRYYDEDEEEWIIKNEKYISGFINVPFNYFGGKYIQHVETTSSKAGSDSYTKATTTNSMWSIEQKTGLHYKAHHYFPKGTKEYEALSDKKYSLEQKYKMALQKKSKQNGNNVKLGLIYLPAIITVIIALLALFWTFTGTEGLEEAINKGFIFAWLNEASQGDGIMKIIAFLPAVFIKIAAICWYIPALIGSWIKMEKIVVIICMVLLIFGGISVSAMIEDHIWPDYSKTIAKKEWREAKHAKKEAEKIANSPRFKELHEQHMKMVGEYREFSQSWQKSWFEAWESKNK